MSSDAVPVAVIAEFLPLAAARREDPGDDLLSLLAVNTTLDLEEVVVNAILLAIAGHETTANMLGNSMIRLLTEVKGGRLTDRIDYTAPEVVGELFLLE
jgi:cytochrome P450